MNEPETIESVDPAGPVDPVDPVDSVDSVDPSTRRFFVRTIVVSQFAPPFMFSGVAVALPAMGRGLDLGATSLGLIETLFLAGALAFLLPIGRLADLTDKRTFFKLGLLGFGLASLSIGLASSPVVILGIRFFQGIMSAIIATTGPAILVDAVPESERGRAYGQSLAAIYSGLTLGPVCAGFMVSLGGWRAVFYLGALPLLVAALMVHRRIPSSWRRPTEPLHLPSVLTLPTSILCLVAGSVTLQQGVLATVLLAIGVVLGVAFVSIQARIERPLFDLRAWSANRVLRQALLVQTLIYIIALGSIFLLSLYLQVSLGQSADVTGWILTVGTVSMAVLSPFTGSLADRIHPGKVSTLGVALLLLSSLLAISLGPATAPFFVVVVLALQGSGYAFFSSPNMAMVMASVPPEEASMAAALSSKSRSLGVLVGMLVINVLISLRIGNDPVDRHPEVFIEILGTAFGIFAATAALALAISATTVARPRSESD